jgi:phage terminase large subunit
MEISLSEKQAQAWEYLEDQTTNEILYGGGAGGGKSYLGCIWHIYRRTTYPKSRGLIGRAKISSLEQSTLITLFKVANKMGYIQGVHFKYNSQKHIITWQNGSETVLKDLFLYPSDPDFMSLGSTEYTDAFIDEAPEITLKAKEIVSSRIRWMLDDFGLSPKLLLTGNPAEGHIKETYISKDGVPVELQPYQKFVQSLVSENPDEGFKARYIQQLERLSSDYDKQRLLHGDWEASREVQSPFATQWLDSKHISDAPEYDIKKQLIISIDFNLNPFCVTFHHYWQDNAGVHLHQFDEAEIKQGSIPAMIDFIKQRYKSSLPNAIITGDAMGNRGDISQRDNATLYLQLIRGLGMREGQIKVSNNPTHENSRADVNYVLYNFPDYKINRRCVGTIRDMRNVQVDAFGGIIKKDRKDVNQRADYIDTVRYLIHNICYKWIESHQRK